MQGITPSDTSETTILCKLTTASFTRAIERPHSIPEDWKLTAQSCQDLYYNMTDTTLLNLTTFTKFPSLPAEIQLDIWDHIARDQESRTIHIADRTITNFIVALISPPLSETFLVCKDAKDAVMSRMTRITFVTATGPKDVYVDFAKDVFKLENLYTYVVICESLQASVSLARGLRDIHHNLQYVTFGYGSARMTTHTANLLNKLKALKLITVAVYDHQPKMYHARHTADSQLCILHSSRKALGKDETSHPIHRTPWDATNRRVRWIDLTKEGESYAAKA